MRIPRKLKKKYKKQWETELCKKCTIIKSTISKSRNWGEGTIFPVWGCEVRWED